MPNLESRLASCLLVVVCACGGGGGGGSKPAPGVDAAPPLLLSMTPQGTAPCPVGSTVTLQFDESLAPATVNGSSVFLADAYGNPVAVAWQLSGNVIQLTPLAPLAWSTTYVVTVTQAVTDMTGNHLPAAIQRNFSTEAMADVVPPTIVDHSPANDAANVLANAVVKVTFSEPVAVASVTGSTLTLATLDGAQVAATVSASGSTATLQPASALAWSTTYRVTVADVKDLAGNALANPGTWSFTTGTPPSVVQGVPEPGTTGVDPALRVSLTFNQQMDGASLTAGGLTVTDPGDHLVAGSVSTSGNFAEWTPASSLAFSTTYTVQLTTAASSALGIHVAAPVSWTFTTAGPGVGTWHAIAAGPLTPRANAVAVWTGSEMIVWGGRSFSNGVETLYRDGARYDPARDAWTPMSTSGAPSPRSFANAVWTGTEMIVWSGYPWSNTGGRYNPATNTWVSLPPAFTARVGSASAWTGSKFFVWGGYGSPGYLDTGGLYDPAQNLWAPTPVTVLQPATYARAVWTGDRVAIFGGEPGFSGGALFDPSSNTWTATPACDAGTGSHRSQHAQVWTGSRVMLWGGNGAGPDGAAFDPSASGGSPAWTAMSTTDQPTPRIAPTGVWTGERMLVWGGGGLRSGGLYDPALDAWQFTAWDGAPSGRGDQVGVWTGTQLLVWGGYGAGGFTATGGRYLPPSNAGGMRVRARTGAMYDLEGTHWVRCEGGTPAAGQSTRSREVFAAGTWTLTKEVFSTNPFCSGSADPGPFTVTASLTVGPDRAVDWISGPPQGLPPTVTASGILLSAVGQTTPFKTLRYVDDVSFPPRLAGGKDAAGSPVDADGFPVSLVTLDGVKE